MRSLREHGLSDARATLEVLGLSFESLGMGIARSWGFPDQLVQTMKVLPGGKVRKSTNNTERLQALAAFSNELCEIVLSTPDAERGQALVKLTTRFGDSLSVTGKQLAALVEKSIQDIAPFALAVNVNLKQSAFAQQASKWAGMARVPDAAPVPEADKDNSQGAAPDARTALDANVLHEHAPILDAAAREPGGTSPRI